MAKLGVSAIRINCQDLRPEVYGVEKMEIVTDYANVCSDSRVNRYLTWKVHNSIDDTIELMKSFVARYESDLIKVYQILK